LIPSVRVATVARDLGAQQFRLLVSEYEEAVRGKAVAPEGRGESERVPVAVSRLKEDPREE
jgi:hypothetical protein